MGIEKLDKDLIAMAVPKITEKQRIQLTGLNEKQIATVTAEVAKAFDTLTCIQPVKFTAGIDVQEVVVYIATRIKDIGRGG